MAEHAWSVLCDRTILDRDTNNLSMDAIERVQLLLSAQPPAEVPVVVSPATPTIVPMSLRMASLWYRDGDAPSRARARIRVIAPGGQELGQTEFDVDLTNRRMRTVSRLDALLVVGSGIYHFEVDRRTDGGLWERVARVPLEVDVVALPATPGAMLPANH